MYPLPRHLKGVVIPSGQSEECTVEGKVACPCGSENFRLMYPGHTHTCRGELIPCTAEIEGHYYFVLRADCSNCDTVHLLFDSHFHGWDGFICHDIEMAALPRPELTAWTCLGCGGDEHKLVVKIAGESLEDFEENAGEDFGPESWPEAFGWITVDASCVKCGKRTEELVSYETM